MNKQMEDVTEKMLSLQSKIETLEKENKTLREKCSVATTADGTSL